MDWKDWFTGGFLFSLSLPNIHDCMLSCCIIYFSDLALQRFPFILFPINILYGKRYRTKSWKPIQAFILKKTHIGPGHWYKLGAIYGPISSNNLRVDIALERMKVEKFNEKNWMTICLIWFKMSLEPWGTNETIFTMVIAIAYHQMTLTKSLN